MDSPPDMPPGAAPAPGGPAAPALPDGGNHDHAEGPHGHGDQGLRPALVLGAIGVVFGDIGTSPLYTLQECLSDKLGAPASDPANVVGVTSLIVWALTLVVTVKYLLFLMRADNHGEGGIMALLALVPERLRAAPPGKVGAVVVLAIAGASLLFGDGIITPAISVLSAVEGLGVATAAFKPWVVPITVVILIALFSVQRRGTGGLGGLFGPVMVVWFLTIGGLGLWHTLQNPSILVALSPLPAIGFFARHGAGSLKLLGGVVLAVTGGEALYADMGHFGARSMRAGWLGLVYPALVLCYLGQAGNLMAHPALAGDAFYGMVGESRMFIYPLVILASMATVIASQALISGVFSLTHQAVQLGLFPRVQVLHTSGEAEGQIYVPFLNVGLAVSCVALVLLFKQSSALAGAYGLAVSGTMLITTVIYAVVVRTRWRWSVPLTVLVVAFFLSFDVPFVVANALKFFDGGYLPFTVGAGFTLAMVSWRIGRGLLSDFFAGEPPFDAFLASLGSTCRVRLPGTMVVLASNAEKAPPVLTRMISRFHVLYEHMVLLTVVVDHRPEVPEAERVTLTDLGDGFRRVVAHFGFMERPDVPQVVGQALARMAIAAPPEAVLYALGRETLVVSRKGRMGPVTERIFALLSRNAASAANYFGIPPEQVVELGAQIDL